MIPQVPAPEHPSFSDDRGLSSLLEATSQAEGGHFWFRGFRRFVHPFLEAAANGRRDLRIADCGAGTGYNLRLLEPYGTPVGIELTRAGVAIARARGERRMARGTVAALPLGSGCFDLAVSFDVLYCLPDDVEHAALAEMHRILKPGGRLVVNVAAMPMLAGEHSGFALERRRYTQRGLTERLERAGFVIRRATYTNAATLPIVAVTRALQRRGVLRMGGGPSRDIQTPAAPINMALTAALTTEAALLRYIDLPFGSSLLALAERR